MPKTLSTNAQKCVKELRMYQDSLKGKAWSHVQRAIALVVTADTGATRRAPSKKKKATKKRAKKA